MNRFFVFISLGVLEKGRTEFLVLKFVTAFL